MNDNTKKLSKEARAMLDAWNGRVCIIPTNVDSELLGVRYANAVANNGESIVVTWEAGRDHRFCRTSGLCLASSDASMADWKIAPWEMHRYNPAIAEERASAMLLADGAKETANAMVAGADAISKSEADVPAKVAKKDLQDLVTFAPESFYRTVRILVIVPNDIYEMGDNERAPFIAAALRMMGQQPPKPNEYQNGHRPVLIVSGDTLLSGLRVQSVIIVSSTPVQAWDEFQARITPRLEAAALIVLMPRSSVEKAIQCSADDIADAWKSATGPDVQTNVRTTLDDVELSEATKNNANTAAIDSDDAIGRAFTTLVNSMAPKFPVALTNPLIDSGLKLEMTFEREDRFGTRQHIKLLPDPNLRAKANAQPS